MDQPRTPGLDTKGSVFARAEKPQQQLPPFVLLQFQRSSAAAAKRAKISIFHPKGRPWQPPSAGIWGYRPAPGCAGALILQPELNFPPEEEEKRQSRALHPRLRN